MSELSGFDSEVVGFDAIIEEKRSERSNSTQTYYSETHSSSQTTCSYDNSTMTTMTSTVDECMAKAEEQYNSSLNEFLKKVVPSMLQQLGQIPADDPEIKELNENSSESDEEDVLDIKLLFDINLTREMSGAIGDFRITILSLSWSSAGNSLAISIGQNQHENWCEHDGLIKIYTYINNKFIHTKDLTEKNCVTVVKYHPAVAAFLAYGTISGDVVICSLRDDLDMTLTSPSGCHGSRRVTGLFWADAPLINQFMVLYINKTGKRRTATDQILISSGSDGTMNVWKCNATLKTFENVVTYNVNGSQKTTPLNITCFDFIKTFPLRPSQEKVSDDIFVVGTNSGQLYLCKIKSNQIEPQVDPVHETLEGHSTCVLDLAFSQSKPGVFVTLAMDSEMRVYHVNETAPIKIFTLDVPVTCLSWVPHCPHVAVGAAGAGGVSVRSPATGRAVPARGLAGTTAVSAMALVHVGSCRLAAGDTDGHVKIYELPTRSIKVTLDDLEF